MEEKDVFTILLKTKNREYPLFQFRGTNYTEFEICDILRSLVTLNLKMYEYGLFSRSIDRKLNLLWSRLPEKADLYLVEDGFLDFLVDEISIDMQKSSLFITYCGDDNIKLHCDTILHKYSTVKNGTLFFKVNVEQLLPDTLKNLIRDTYGIHSDDLPIYPSLQTQQITQIIQQELQYQIQQQQRQRQRQQEQQQECLIS
jgi:hypothetical protein